MRCHIYFTLALCMICADTVLSLVQGSSSRGSEWSIWIDNNHRRSILFEDEVENIDKKELGKVCSYGIITEIECVPVGGVDGLHKELDQNITCDVQNGLVCFAKNNRPHGCLDYKIRYRCGPYLDRKVRKRQALLPFANCNSWHPWINENHPNSTNKNDNENLTKSELLSFCPINSGASITKFECKDEKGEPFSGVIRDNANRYASNCTNYQEGLTCEFIDLNSADQCPDYSFRFYCNCSVEVGSSTLTAISGRTTSKHGAIYQSSRPTSTVKPVTSRSRSAVTSTDKQSNREGQSDSSAIENHLPWLILFIVCVCLCAINLALMIFLHKRAMKYSSERLTKVRPSAT